MSITPKSNKRCFNCGMLEEVCLCPATPKLGRCLKCGLSDLSCTCELALPLKPPTQKHIELTACEKFSSMLGLAESMSPEERVGTIKALAAFYGVEW